MPNTREQFRADLTAYLASSPTSARGAVLKKSRPVRFGYPGGNHRDSRVWVYRPRGVPHLEMVIGFFKNFTPDDLICKVIESGETITDGSGASIQFNANRCMTVNSGEVALQHTGEVTLGTRLARADLLDGLRARAPQAYLELGGDTFFGSWPVLLGTVKAPGTLLDNLFLYAYGVEQVKRHRRGEGPLPAWEPPGRRRYWFTVHWPPAKGDVRAAGVFLDNPKKHVAANLNPGDYVWTFESRTGRAKSVVEADGSTRSFDYEPGERAVVTLARMIEPIRFHDVPEEEYADGSRKRWCWRARGEPIRTSGRVPHQDAAAALGYKRNYSFRGFGTDRSGLMEIPLEVHQALLNAYDAGASPLPTKGPPPRSGGPGGGEGPEHKRLKEDVFADPAGVLGEHGLEPLALEFQFQTGDRADVMLTDADGKFVAVEIEVSVEMKDLSGVLQAIKYSRMYALVARRPYHEGRAMLVAHAVDDDVKALCGQYGVEVVEVDRAAV